MEARRAGRTGVGPSIGDLVAALRASEPVTPAPVPAPQTIAQPQTHTLLALDLGAHTGWALWQNGVVTSGTWDLNPARQRRFEGPGMKFVRFTQLLGELPAPTLLYFEEVRRHLGVDAAHAYGGYLSHLTAFCDTRKPQIPYQGVPVATIKQRATGKGNATKEDMLAACAQHLGRNVTDDNECDALWLLVIMCEAMKLPWPGGPVAMPVVTKPAKKTKTKKAQ